MPRMNDVDSTMPILLIDDSQSMRRIARNCLKQLGFENVTEADSGTSAVELLNSAEFKLIISDWSMPDVDTEQLLRELRSRGDNVPVLIVAATQERQSIPEFKASEKTEVIIKPFTKEILQQKMESVLHS